MKRLIILIFTISIIRLIFVLYNDSNKYKEYNGIIEGTINNIKKDKDKTVFDVQADVKYRINYYNNFNYNLGDKVKVIGIIYTPKNNTISNLFNYRKYLLSKKILFLVKCKKIVLIGKNKNVLYKIKNNMIKRSTKYKSSNYIKAFLLADTSAIEDQIKSNYQSIGISHLLAVSGMHVGTFLLILKFILKKFRYKDIIIFLFLLFFLFITNFTESLMRCTLFIFLNYINKQFKFNIKSSYVLILTGSLLLFYNPYLIYSTGFLFSVIITFFIIMSNSIINKYHNYFIKIFCMSVISFLASVPILAITSFKINILSPLLNVIFVPFVSIIIFPFTILTFLIRSLDNVLLFFIYIFESLTSMLSNIKIFTFIICKPSIIVIFIYYLILYLSIKYNHKFIILFIVVLIININSRFFIFNSQITFLDVGQGDSCIFILPEGKTVMIDTGGNYNYDLSKKSTIPYLNSLGISKISYLVLTHGDFDHMGEATNLVENFKVENVVFNYGPHNDLEKKLIKVLENKNIKYYKGLKELNIENHKLQFLNTIVYDNENDNSNVIYLNYNNYKFLFMGDAGVQREKDILDKYNIRDIDFLKVGHHGSNTSSSEDFINKIRPKYSLISVGKNNRYGHPKDSVLDTLKGSKIYRTDKDGSIEIKVNKNSYKISTCPP